MQNKFLWNERKKSICLHKTIEPLCDLWSLTIGGNAGGEHQQTKNKVFKMPIRELNKLLEI